MSDEPVQPKRPDDVPVTDEVRQEIERRLGTYEADKAKAQPWAEVKARLAARVPSA